MKLTLAAKFLIVMFITALIFVGYNNSYRNHIRVIITSKEAKLDPFLLLYYQYKGITISDHTPVIFISRENFKMNEKVYINKELIK